MTDPIASDTCAHGEERFRPCKACVLRSIKEVRAQNNESMKHRTNVKHHRKGAQPRKKRGESEE